MDNTNVKNEPVDGRVEPGHDGSALAGTRRRER